MDTEKIEKIISVARKFNVDELEIHEENSLLKIKMKPSFDEHKSTKQIVYIEDEIIQNDSKKEISNLYIIKSPMVGIVYLSSSPNTDRFVALNQKIEIGSTLCIIEAMKVFNKIESDVIGIIKEIYVQNEQPIEYGAPLFAIEINDNK